MPLPTFQNPYVIMPATPRSTSEGRKPLAGRFLCTGTSISIQYHNLPAHVSLIESCMLSSSPSSSKAAYSRLGLRGTGSGKPCTVRAHSRPLGVNLAACCTYFPRNWNTGVEALGIQNRTSGRSEAEANLFWHRARQNLRGLTFPAIPASRCPYLLRNKVWNM